MRRSDIIESWYSRFTEKSQQWENKNTAYGESQCRQKCSFSKLTGVHVDSSNYAGTTADYTVGDINFGNKQGIMIDVPGTYSLEATSEAEKVAVALLEENADVIICVLDATHLERNLDLAYQLRNILFP